MNNKNETDLEILNKIDNEISNLKRLKEIFPEMENSLNSYTNLIFVKQLEMKANIEKRNINFIDKEIELRKAQLDEQIKKLIRNNNNSNSKNYSIRYSNHYLKIIQSNLKSQIR